MTSTSTPGLPAPSSGVFGSPVRIDGTGVKGMAVARDGTRLFVGAGPVLYALDATDPLAPRVLGSISGFDNLRQIRVRGDFVYVVSRETGLYVVDVSNPARMRLRSRYDTIEMATGIEVAGDVAFVSERIYGIEAVDVRNPDRPEFIALRKTPESQSCRYRDGWLYSGEWGVGEITVFDARDLRDWRAVAIAELGGLGDGLELSGDRLYCSTGHHARHTALSEEEAFGNGRGLDIFDVSDPAHPRRIGRASFPRMTAHEEDYWTVRVAGTLAFCADSHNGLFAVDVSDPAAPRVVDRLCIPQEGRSWPSVCISSVEPGEGCLYMTAWPGGFYVVPVAGVRPEPRPLGAVPSGTCHRETPPTDEAKFHVWHPAAAGLARSVSIRGDVAYAAFGDAGLHALRLDEERGFVQLGTLPGGRRVTDCCLAGDRILTAEGLDGFALYDLPSPGQFREVARLKSAGTGGSVAFWCWAPDESHVLLSARDGAYAFYRIDDFLAGRGPAAVLDRAVCWHRYPADRAVDGRLPVLYPYFGIAWADLSGPAPTLLSDAFAQQQDAPPPADQRNGVCRFGDRFLCTVGDGYVFLDADGRATPWRSLGPDGHRGTPATDGRLVVLTERSGRRVTVWDFATPDAPVLLDDATLAGHPDIGAFWRGRVLVPAGHQGLLLSRRRFTS